MGLLEPRRHKGIRVPQLSIDFSIVWQVKLDETPKPVGVVEMFRVTKFVN
jgi:hypothetical protein